MNRSIISFIIFSILLISAQQAKSQKEEISGDVFYTEFGGAGVMMSFNFDSRFKRGERLGWGYRAGLGFSLGSLEWDYDNATFNYDISEFEKRSFCTVPIGLNYIFGRKNSSNTFEIGGGATFLSRKISIFYYEVAEAGHFIGHVNMMYRRVPINGGFLFRAGFTPIIGTSGEFMPMVAVALGYAF